MRRRHWLAAIGVGLTSLTATGAQAQDGTGVPVYQDLRYSVEERAADLVSRMTLDEKAAQLATTNAPAVPRLGVQEYSYWNEAQHGVSLLLGDYSAENTAFFTTPGTSFPTNLSASLTWNPALMRRETAAIADEARGFLDPRRFGRKPNNLGPAAGAYGSLVYFAPTVNLQRDPRWGRTDEAFGEDPFLTGAMGEAWVNGFQGQTARGKPEGRYLKAVATGKHFALNNVEVTRMTGSSDTDEGTIRDYYTAQFRRLVEDAHVGGLMSSYNAINGTPASANAFTLNVLARRTWGFDGYVTSDCGGVATTYRRPDVPIGQKGTALYFAGHDWAPPGWTTTHTGEAARWLRTGPPAQVSAQAGAEAFTLRAGNELNCAGDNGLVGHPPSGDVVRVLTGRENRIEFIREAILAGILSEDVIDRSLVHVFTLRMRTGEFDPRDQQPYTKISGAVIESAAHRKLAQDVAAQALTLLKNAPAGGRTPLLPVDATDVRKVVILGDQADKVWLGGYAGIPTEQISVREGITDFLERVNPKADVVYDSGQSSTTATEPARLEPETQEAIRTADLVLVMVGTDAGTNAEGTDRSNLAMPGNYTSLVEQAASLGNPRVALLVQSAGGVELGGVQDRVASILYSGPNGQRQGRAAADAVFGTVNPSGHLSFTWYRDSSQLPDIENYNLKPSQAGGLGRTYQYFTGTPAYPFGYGGSYTKFRYSKITISRRKARVGGVVRLSATVTNTGRRAGATVAQVYATPPASAGHELPRRLVGFRKTHVLAPRKSQRIGITVPLTRTLRLWDDAQERTVVHPGRWRFDLARSAADRVRSYGLQVTGAISSSVAHVSVQPEQLSLTPGQTIDLRGKNRWLEGLAPTDLPGAATDIVSAVRSDDSFVDLSNAPVAFASNRPDVARVDTDGSVTAVSPGAATITVSVDGVTSTTVLVVKGS